MTIKIRDMIFPDPTAAAAFFGIQRRAILRAIRLGTLDRVGLRPHQTRHRAGPVPFEVRIRGVVYASCRAAAEAHGVSEITVRTALQKGRHDFIGFGRSRKHSTASCGQIPHNAQTVIIGRIAFQSKAELARFCGLGQTTIREHLRRGNMSILLGHVMRAQARQEGHRQRMPGQPPLKSDRQVQEEAA